MQSARAKNFRLIETADNFVKYAGPGREARAAGKARKRYERAEKLARDAGDDQLIEQIRLRVADLDRRAAAIANGSTSELEPWGDEEIASASPPEHATERVPPGQRVTRGWPVLHEGPIPRFDPAVWTLQVDGFCARPLSFSYEELKALPNVEMTSDFHCVTGWSKLDNLWRGVRTKTLLEQSSPLPDARYVTVHADHGYTANVPIAVLLEEESLLTWSHNARDLAPKHGFPLRLLIPRLYAWKSVKWVRRLELLTEDRRGFWEVRGYHNRADPWREERYSYQEG